MGGARFNEDDYKDPLINVRFANRYGPFNLFGDIGYFPKRERERGYWLAFAALPLSSRWLKPQIGIESENVHYPEKPDSWGLGPRITMSLMKATATLAYQVRSDRDLIRIYATLNL